MLSIHSHHTTQRTAIKCVWMLFSLSLLICVCAHASIEVRACDLQKTQSCTSDLVQVYVCFDAAVHCKHALCGTPSCATSIVSSFCSSTLLVAGGVCILVCWTPLSALDGVFHWPTDIEPSNFNGWMCLSHTSRTQTKHIYYILGGGDSECLFDISKTTCLLVNMRCGDGGGVENH